MHHHFPRLKAFFICLFFPALLLRNTTLADAPELPHHDNVLADNGSPPLSTEATNAKHEAVVAGYFPDYRSYIDLNATASNLTDLILFSISPRPDGSIRRVRGRRPCCLDSSHYRMAREAREYKRVVSKERSAGEETMIRDGEDGDGGRRKVEGNNNDLRLLVSLGGAGRSEHFSAIVSDSERRSRLVSELLDLCIQEQLDGVDFDWEKPRTKEEVTGYFTLISETASAFRDHYHRDDGRGRRLLVTAALHPVQLLTVRFYDHVDRFHLMTYDFLPTSASATASASSTLRHHSSMAQTVEAVDEVLRVGCPPSKITVGIPAYGRHEDQRGRVMTYAEIVDEVLSGGDTKEQREGTDFGGDVTSSHLSSAESSRLVSMNSFKGFRFDSARDVDRKVRWSINRALAGVFFWEIGQDKVGGRGGEHSLIASAALAARSARSSSTHEKQSSAVKMDSIDDGAEL